MKTIWKFPLEVTDMQLISMPFQAEILSVQTQNEIPCLYALVTKSNMPQDRCFEIFGTGNPVYCDMGIERKFIGTFQLKGGALVFHIFERLINGNNRLKESR